VRLRRPSALQVAVGALAALALVFILAPVFAPFDPNGVDPANAFAEISATHPFGTDDLGRDLLSRILYGGRLTLLISGGAVVVALILGTLWGFFAATRGGWPDELLMRTADVLMAIPQLLFALVFVSAFGPSVTTLILVIGVLLSPSTARMARSVALTEMGRDYYAAAIAYGATPSRLLFRELLPNTKTPIAIQAAINAASAIILEATLSFVGLGIQPPDASLGTLLQQGYGFLYQCWEYIVFPGLAILLLIWLLNVVADQLGEGRGRLRRR
jgi:peptide/nickel transport system permease protein